VTNVWTYVLVNILYNFPFKNLQVNVEKLPQNKYIKTELITDKLRNVAFLHSSQKLRCIVYPSEFTVETIIVQQVF